MYDTHLHRSQVDSELFTSVPSVNLELSNHIGGPATPSIKVKERSDSLPITREGLEIIGRNFGSCLEKYESFICPIQVFFYAGGHRPLDLEVDPT